jgi:RND family efflux transporter MFP subunit
MGVTGRQSIALAAGLLVMLGLAAGVYVVRDRARTADAPTASHDHAASPQAAAPAGTIDRGNITIDPQQQRLLGVRLAMAVREAHTTAVRTTGVVRYDETRLVDVNLKLEGWIRDLHVNFTGQLIHKGQPLFTLYSPDLLATQNEYLLALRARDQARTSEISDAREYADRILDAARQRLELWDLPPEEIAVLDETRQPRQVITFRSPAGGYVIDKQAVQGMHVTPGQTLYKLADLSVVWVEADLYERDMSMARAGQRATVTLDAYPGESFQGRATYIFPFVDASTRTVKVRFQFANPRGHLKPGMYANVALQGATGMALTVPADAVLDSGTQQVVFVAMGEGHFSPRTVRVGRRLGDRIEVLDGLQEHEQVATGATFFLDSESQLRAGLQNYQPPATPVEGAGPAAPNRPGSPARSGSPATAARFGITFRTQPDPPRTGESIFEVAVKDTAGRPVIDADVSVQQFMAAMPTMNMPAMRSETKLPHAGGGIYRGPAQVMMAGRWEITVVVSRNGQALARQPFPMLAR